MFSVKHALSYAKGRFPSIWQNEIRNLTASLLTEVCHDICTEPKSNNILTGASANCKGCAQLDSRKWVLRWDPRKNIFDIWLFNPRALWNRHTLLSSCSRNREQMKKIVYKQGIREVANALFSTLVVSTTGGHVKEPSIFYRRIGPSACCKMGPPLQQHTWLATLSSGFHPNTFCYSVHQRSSILMWACHQDPKLVDLVNVEANISLLVNS